MYKAFGSMKYIVYDRILHLKIRRQPSVL